MKIEESFEFFHKLHKGQKYNDGDPYYPHLLRVGLIIRNTLIINKEGNKLKIDNLTIAGFGHDSLEDTKVDIELLRRKFGKEITSLILSMTNEEGDSHTSNYISKICKSKEEVRIIKLADICDNLTRIIHNPKNYRFLKKKVLPIIEPMQKQIIKTKFKKYQKSAKQLIEMSNILILTAKNILDQNHLLQNK